MPMARPWAPLSKHLTDQLMRTMTVCRKQDRNEMAGDQPPGTGVHTLIRRAPGRASSRQEEEERLGAGGGSLFSVGSVGYVLQQVGDWGYIVDLCHSGGEGVEELEVSTGRQ